MLTIKTTPNLYGLSIQGDYNDLNTLYDALSRYLEFYQEHAVAYPYHEYEYLLSLNYDLRHACQGDRGYTLAENNASQIGLKAECIYELPADFKSFSLSSLFCSASSLPRKAFFTTMFR